MNAAFKPRCSLPWTQTFVNANGVVAPCCAPLELGNLQTDDLREVFTGEGFDRLRTDMAADRSTPATSYCFGCYAAKKFDELQLSFTSQFKVGEDTEASLAAMEGGRHDEFVRNYRNIRDSVMTGKSVAPTAKPLRLEVQLGEHCDIRCIMCWQDHLRPRHLSAENFDQIVDLLPTVHSVQFTGGEPTVYKDFWKLVDAFKQKAQPYATLEVLTHGQHLAEKLPLFDGVRSLYFGINVDGPTRETYEKIRFGASWDKLQESLAAFSKARETHPGWNGSLFFLLMRTNIDLIEESFALSDRYGLGWGCGMVTGEATPVAQCRTYFDENIFRFDHLGWPKAEIVNRLRAAMPAARAKTYSSAMALACLEATVQQVETVQQIAVDPDRALELRSLEDDAALSRGIQDLVTADFRAKRRSIAELNREFENVRGVNDPEVRLRDTVELGARLIENGEFSRAETTLASALPDARSSPGLSDSALIQLKLGQSIAYQGRPDDALPHLRAARAALETSVGPSHSLTAEAALEVGKALAATGCIDEATSSLERAFAAYSKLYGKQQNSYVSVSATELGVVYLAQERFKEASDCLKRALPIHEMLLGPDHSVTAAASIALARALRGLGRQDLLDKHLAAYPASREASAPETPVVSEIPPPTEGSAFAEAGAALQQGRDLISASSSRDAIPYLERAYARYREAFGSQAVSFVSVAADELGAALLSERRFEKAADCLGDALAIHEGLLSPDHSVTAATARALGHAYRELGRNDELAILSARYPSVGMVNAEPPARDARMADALERASAWEAAGDPQAAMQVLREALDSEDADAGVVSRDAATARLRLGQASRGAPASAEVLFREAEQAFAQAGDPHDLLWAEASLELGRALAGAGRHVDAGPPLRRALDMFSQAYPDRPVSYVSVAATELARVGMEAGDFEAAAELFARALPIHEALLGPEHSTTQEASRLLSRCLAAAELAEAEYRLNRLAEICERDYGADHEITLAVRVGQRAVELTTRPAVMSHGPRSLGVIRRARDKGARLLKRALA